MTSMTSCIVGKKIRAMGPGPLELFPFVVLTILLAMAGGISEHMLTSWSSLIFFAEKNVSSFCTAKATRIFSAKNFSIFAYHLM